MGTFHVPVEIGDPDGRSWESVEALVDTGSTYTWVPAPLLGRLGVQPQFSREFETAVGRVIPRDMAVTMARLDGQALPTLVVFGEDSDAALLGAYTLEGFALAPDPINRRLVRVRGLAMPASSLRASVSNGKALRATAPFVVRLSNHEPWVVRKREFALREPQDERKG